MKTTPWEVDSRKFSNAYVGGFLDGDGSIVATLEDRPERRRFPYRIRLKINFTQHHRHISLMVQLQKFLGGVGSIRTTLSHHLVELVIQDRTEVEQTLRRLLPFIILKERQATLMLSAITIYNKSKVNVRSSLLEKEFDAIVKIVRAIRALNSRSGGKRTV
jgi:hypothetical protein